MTDHRELADAVLQVIPNEHIIRRMAFKAVRARDLQRDLDRGITTPRRMLRDLSERGMVAPHLEAAVVAALTGEAAT